MYDLFNKKLDDLVFEDLYTLIENEVKEGFYVEFKSDFQKGQHIAKSLASFANTHGGWYFIGVADEDKTNIAKDIVGFDIKKHNQPQESIRQISREHIHPIPFFEMKLLKNSEDKYVLVIFIPESFETPHILSDGVVYLRNGEESNPIKNGDKYTLDKLYQKNLYLESKLNSILKNPFGVTYWEEKEEIPFLNLCFLPKNFNELEFKNFYEDFYLEKLIEMITQEEYLFDSESGISFNNYYKSITRTPHSIIFRNVSNGISSRNHTLELFYNGAARMKIPIPYTIIETPLHENNSQTPCIKLLYQKLGENLRQYKLVDIGSMLFSITWTINKYSRFINDNMSSQTNTFSIFEMENTFQLIPFVESESFIDHVEKYHVPICMYKYKKVPDELSSKRWIELEKFDDLDFRILDSFKMVLGLPVDTKIFRDSVMHFIEKHQNAVESPRN